MTQHKKLFENPEMQLAQLNSTLENPTKENIQNVFHNEGYLRLNMLYLSPIALKQFKEKLVQMNLQSWSFGENELVFRMKGYFVSFRGSLRLTYKEAKIFCLELDFDPVISDNTAIEFLTEVEQFLKKCDAIFFMTCSVSIDSEILDFPLSETLNFLASRK